jgi:DNA-binding CsgD family transcriptional regulator
MGAIVQKLEDVWSGDKNRVPAVSRLPVSVGALMDNIAASIVSTGPFYYYVVDFSDFSLSHVSPSMADILGLDIHNATFHDVLGTFHPDDWDFITKAETATAAFIHKNVKPKDLLNYKSNFNFRCRLKDGSYGLINHQAMMLVPSADGGYGRALNIHTLIGHLTKVNTHTYSVIHRYGGKSFLNLPVEGYTGNSFSYTRREIEILKLIAQGLDSNTIADKLFISAVTVKKHRANILTKSGCNNIAQLIKDSVLQGLI